MFEFFIDQLTQLLAQPDNSPPRIKKARSRSFCQTPTKYNASNKISKTKSQKVMKRTKTSLSIKGGKKSMNDQDLNRTFLSERKQKINQTCIICGKRPCDNRLACAHAVHEECFVKSGYIPRCRKCESKNISYLLD